MTKARTAHTSLNISFIYPANINILIPFDSVISSFRQRLVNLNKSKIYHVAESKEREELRRTIGTRDYDQA